MALEKRISGKRILNAKQSDRTEVIAAYRSQSRVEDAFSQLKDTSVFSLQPMHNWTSVHIRVNAFNCVCPLRFQFGASTSTVPEEKRSVATAISTSTMYSPARCPGAVAWPCDSPHKQRPRSQPVPSLASSSRELHGGVPLTSRHQLSNRPQSSSAGAKSPAQWGCSPPRMLP